MTIVAAILVLLGAGFYSRTDSGKALGYWLRLKVIPASKWDHGFAHKRRGLTTDEHLGGTYSRAGWRFCALMERHGFNVPRIESAEFFLPGDIGMPESVFKGSMKGRVLWSLGVVIRGQSVPPMFDFTMHSKEPEWLR